MKIRLKIFFCPYSNENISISQRKDSKSNSIQDHEDPNENRSASRVISTDGLESQDQSGRPFAPSQSTQNADQGLEEKDKEKDHETDGTVISECFVDWAEP